MPASMQTDDTFLRESVTADVCAVFVREERALGARGQDGGHCGDMKGRRHPMWRPVGCRARSEAAPCTPPSRALVPAPTCPSAPNRRRASTSAHVGPWRPGEDPTVAFNSADGSWGCCCV